MKEFYDNLYLLVFATYLINDEKKISLTSGYNISFKVVERSNWIKMGSSTHLIYTLCFYVVLTDGLKKYRVNYYRDSHSCLNFLKTLDKSEKLSYIYSGYTRPRHYKCDPIFKLSLKGESDFNINLYQILKQPLNNYILEFLKNIKNETENDKRLVRRIEKNN